MNRMILISAMAISMILIALGMSQGTVDAESADAMMVLLPGIALAALQSSKGCSLRPAACAGGK